MTAAGAAATPQPVAAMGQRQDQNHQAVPSDLALRVKALESLLVEKGLVDARPSTRSSTPSNTRSVRERRPRGGAGLGRPGLQAAAARRRDRGDRRARVTGGQGEHMVVVENTPAVHNVIVCTLCSCYPWPMLGLPPVWYKSAPYRSRAVIDPRGVLREFGRELPEDVEVRVWDSTAELRYMVLPERPAGTDGMSEEELAALVTRDSMVGVARVTPPASGGRMNGIHDMGGSTAWAPVQYERDEPVFHEQWEGRVWALNRALAAWRKWNIDAAGTRSSCCRRWTISA